MPRVVHHDAGMAVDDFAVLGERAIVRFAFAFQDVSLVAARDQAFGPTIRSWKTASWMGRRRRLQSPRACLPGGERVSEENEVRSKRPSSRRRFRMS